MENQPKKRRFKLNKTNIIFISGLIIFLIPFIVLGSILFSAQMNTGKINSGDRFKEDFNPAITKDEISNIKADLKQLPNVKNVEIDLQTGTLKVFLEFDENMSETDIKQGINAAYSKVTNVLPIEEYFTADPGVKRQYDLEVQGFNLASDPEAFIYYVLKKSATMEIASLQLISEPVDPAYTQQILDRYAEQHAEKEVEPEAPVEDEEPSE